MIKMQATKVNGEWEIILPEHRANRPEWKTGWETKRLKSMFHNLKDNDTVLYIGAEEGDMAALMCLWRDNIDMHLFEPNPKVWPNIRAIWKANQLNTPMCYVGFCSRVNAQAKKQDEFYKKRGDKNGWPLCAYGEVIGNHGFRHLAEETDVTPQITVDEYVSNLGLTPNVITMDVEGSELEVLKGAIITLSKTNRPLVYVSIHPEFIEEMYHNTREDVLKFMENLGYKAECLERVHEEHWLFR